MKILFIAPKYSGGIGGHAKRVADKLRENGFEIELMYAPHLPIKKLKNLTFAISSILKVIFERKKYDVVHAFNIPSAFAMKYSKARKKILSVHGVYSEQIDILHSQRTSSKIKNNEEKVLRWADMLLTNSKNVQRSYKEKFGLNFDYIYGPIDIEKFKNIPESITKNEKQVVYIGRDSYEKGIDILKQIEPKLDAKVVYCINVEWEKAMYILKSSDVVVVPSRIDNIPNVIKESFFLKIPVIATDIPGISEIVTNDINGILVPPEDPERLANAINELLKDKKKSVELAQKGFEFIMKNMTWDVLLPKYIEFYEKLIKQ